MVTQTTKTVTSTPAAGAEVSQVVPGGVTWEVQALSAKLVTSATVANRVPTFIVTDEFGNEVAGMTTAINQAASLTWVYSLMAQWHASAVNVGLRVQGQFPVMGPLKPGWKITTVTAAIAVGDQWSTTLCVVEKPIVPGWGA